MTEGIEILKSAIKSSDLEEHYDRDTIILAKVIIELEERIKQLEQRLNNDT